MVQCCVCGALAAALGLIPSTSSASDGAARSLWGRVVLMQLEGSGRDAVRSSCQCRLQARDAWRRCSWSSCCTRSWRRLLLQPLLDSQIGSHFARAEPMPIAFAVIC